MSGRRKKEEGRRKKEEGRRKIFPIPHSPLLPFSHSDTGTLGQDFLNN
jgi:hypothetical protein